MAITREAVQTGSAHPGPPRHEELAYRLRQQSVLADFGHRALEASTRAELLDAAVCLCADGMHARFCMAAEFLPDRAALRLCAGIGWKPGIVGHEILDLDSPAGLAFKTGEPLIARHPGDGTRFRTPPVLTEHGIRRTVVVPVPLSHDRRWGSLVTHSPDESGQWDEADIEFMTGMARLLGVAIERGTLRRSLEENRAWLDVLVDTVDQVVWSARPDGYHDFFNGRWYEFCGAEPGTTDGDIWARWLHPDDHARTFAAWRHSLETGEPYEIEYRFKNRSGAYRWTLGRARAVRDASGRIIRWVGTGTDIHAQKEYGERFRMLHQEHPSAYLVLSPDFTVEEASQRWLDATMKRRDEMIGRNLFEAMPDNPEDPAASGVRNLRASLERVLATRADDRMPVQRYDVRRLDGTFERRWWTPVNSPVLGPDGEVRHIIHQVEDVTAEMIERERAAEARAGEEQFRTLADSLPQLAWMADSTGWIYWYNKRWYEFTGTTLDEMRGWGWRAVHHPDHVERVVKRIQHSWDTGEPWEDLFPLRGADGRYRWFLSRAAPVRDAEGRVVRWFGTNTDVTEQQEAAELQRTLLQEVSHRVKNSLALVSSLLTLQSRTLQGDARTALEEASSRVHAIAQVHDQLWRGTDSQHIDLDPFLCNLGEAIATSAPRHATRCRAEPAEVSADLAAPLGLLVNELLTNAYKYAYPEGIEGEVRLMGTREPGGRYRLEIADSGIGLPAGFDLAKARKSLGMRLVTALAAQLRGELTARSADPGTSFLLVFPLES